MCLVSRTEEGLSGLFRRASMELAALKVERNDGKGHLDPLRMPKNSRMPKS